MHTYLPRYAHIHFSLIFWENKTKIANEIHAKARHANIKRYKIQPFIPVKMS